MTSKNKQTIIAVLSNSGGAGKSTIVRNVGYEMSKLGSKVALIDLDPQHNLDLFCGFPLAEQMDNTIIRVLSEKYDGLWSLSPIPNEHIDVCRGHIGMAEIQNELVNRRRSEYVLADRLHKSPLPHDTILIDCPATLGKICENAIVAANYGAHQRYRPRTTPLPKGQRCARTSATISKGLRCQALGRFGRPNWHPSWLPKPTWQARSILSAHPQGAGQRPTLNSQ